MERCSACGEPLERGLRFCTHCGTAATDLPGDAKRAGEDGATLVETLLTEIPVAAGEQTAVMTGAEPLSNSTDAETADGWQDDLFTPHGNGQPGETDAPTRVELKPALAEGVFTAAPPLFRPDGPTRSGRPRWVAPAIAATLLVLALGAAGAFAFLWQDAADGRDTTRQELAAATAQNSVLAAQNRQLDSKLGDATALATQRAALLGRADKVLSAVEPLLSSVDELQTITSEMQSGRSSYQNASDELKSDLISLANYLLDVDLAYADWGWVNSMIDAINGEIETVNYYGGEIADVDSKYDAATSRFSTRATGLNESIRALQKQLKSAVK